MPKTQQFLEWAHSLEPGTMFFNSGNRDRFAKPAWFDSTITSSGSLNLILKISEILRLVLSTIGDQSGRQMNGNQVHAWSLKREKVYVSAVSRGLYWSLSNSLAGKEAGACRFIPRRQKSWQCRLVGKIKNWKCYQQECRTEWQTALYSVVLWIQR